MTETIVALWLAVMLTFARREPRERLASVARTVVEATDDPQEQALLLTVSLYETNFNERGVPFGITSVNRSGHRTLLDDARASLRILRRSSKLCRRSIPQMLGHYHHGRGCIPDRFSVRESNTVRLMTRLYNRDALAAGAPIAPRGVYALGRRARHPRRHRRHRH